MAVCGRDCVPIIGWIFVGLSLAAFAWNTWLITHSHSYRTDLKPGDSVRSGSAPLWQLNVLNPGNYAPGPGRRMHLRIVVSLACQVAALVAAIFTFMFGTS
jgi:hypothetical protein